MLHACTFSCCLPLLFLLLPLIVVAIQWHACMHTWMDSVALWRCESHIIIIAREISMQTLPYQGHSLFMNQMLADTLFDSSLNEYAAKPGLVGGKGF
jgi:hypothetical protein